MDGVNPNQTTFNEIGNNERFTFQGKPDSTQYRRVRETDRYQIADGSGTEYKVTNPAMRVFRVPTASARPVRAG